MTTTTNTTPVYVLGHRNPDTDSICSAICYSELKNKIGNDTYIPMRCGNVSPETRFVLEYFGAEAPAYVDNVYTQVKDVEYRHISGVSTNLSLKKAWEIMDEENLTTLPIVGKHGYLKGVITLGDIAKSYMEIYDSAIISTANTPYINVVETLNAELIVGDPNKSIQEGKVLIAAANPDIMEIYIEKNDIVILGNRYESQLCAIEMDAQCIIICDGSPISLTIHKLAEEKGCAIIRTFYDPYTVARLINQSMPVQHFMKSQNIITFNEEDFIRDIRQVMAKKRFQYYPVLAEDGKYAGMISQRNYLDANPKRVILVDHNEKSQAVDGIDEVNLLEIIDHHRLGGLQTMSPLYFRNMPLGCTATIIYHMYLENQVEISKTIAGLLCAAILSDTLMFRSPTCTAIDRDACMRLAEIAGIDVEDFSTKMFQAGSNLRHKSEDELFHQDFKIFTEDDVTFAVGQVTAFHTDILLDTKARMLQFMRTMGSKLGASTLIFMLTNIYEETTILLYNSELEDFDDILCRAFSLTAEDLQDQDADYPNSGSIYLSNIVSRKKQVVPNLVAALKL